MENILKIFCIFSSNIPVSYCREESVEILPKDISDSFHYNQIFDTMDETLILNFFF